MVLDHASERPSRWAAVTSIAAKIGCTPQTLHRISGKLPKDLRRCRPHSDSGIKGGQCFASVLELSRNEMADRLLEFGGKAQGADLALFFYAGHGIAIEGARYQLPVDADVKSKIELKLGMAIDVDETLEQTMGEAKFKLVFLDTSLNDPFPRKATSASHVSVKTGPVEIKSLDNYVIAYASSAGQPALDGDAGTGRPFTRALIANIAAPGVEIQQAMTKVGAQVNEETNKRQLPWGHTNFNGKIYLSPVAPPAGPGPDPQNSR